MSSEPTKYVRVYDFGSFQTSNPTSPLPANQLEAELNALKSTTDQTIDRLAEIQRSDGALANGIVTKDSLATGLYDEILEDLGGAESPAQDAAEAAAASALQAGVYADNAQASASTAQAAIATAAAHSAAASTAKDAAVVAKDAAEAAQTAAGASATTANNKAVEAAGSAAAAANSEDAAEAWAEKLDGPVDDGRYSAHYWATQATAAAASVRWEHQGAWDDLTAYEPRDVVEHDGSSWVALQADTGTEPGTDPAVWQLVAEAGAAGEDGLAWRGTWTAITSYATDDAVYYDGSAYIALQASLNQAPPTPDDAPSAYWGLLAREGAEGAPGAGTGDVVGPAGATGNNFASFDGPTGKQIKDSGKSAADFAAAAHGHAISDVTGLQTALDGKSATGHGHAISDVTGLQTALDGKLATTLKGAANGVAELDSGGKVPVAQLPAIAITDTFVVASEAAMLALTAETGDVAIRTDEVKTYILKGTDPTVLADWEELQVPGGVASVNGQTGTVVLDAGDIGFTPTGGLVATDVQAALAELDLEKLALTGGTVTGSVTFQTTASYGTVAVFEGTNGAAGPITRSRHPSATPAAFDDLWIHQVLGNSSTGVERTLLEIIAQYVDPTNTSEDARWGFASIVAGAKATRMWLGAGLYADGNNDPGSGKADFDDFLVNGVSINPIGKQTIWVPAAAMTPRVSNGAEPNILESTTNKVNRGVLDFDAAAAEYAQFELALPKSWNAGTITLRYVWESASGTGNVVWGAQGLSISDDDLIDQAFGSAQTVTDGVTAATDTMISPETGAVTIANAAKGDVQIIQVYRDAAAGGDTLAADARLRGVLVHYTPDAATDV